jgi:hypothetical protein
MATLTDLVPFLLILLEAIDNPSATKSSNCQSTESNAEGSVVWRTGNLLIVSHSRWPPLLSY